MTILFINGSDLRQIFFAYFYFIFTNLIMVISKKVKWSCYQTLGIVLILFFKISLVHLKIKNVYFRSENITETLFY